MDKMSFALNKLRQKHFKFKKTFNVSMLIKRTLKRNNLSTSLEKFLKFTWRNPWKEKVVSSGKKQFTTAAKQKEPGK